METGSVQKTSEYNVWLIKHVDFEKKTSANNYEQVLIIN